MGHNAGHEKEVYTLLKKASKTLIVHKKEDLDPSFHYSKNRRIMPIIVSTSEGYRLCKNATVCANISGNSSVLFVFFHHYKVLNDLHCMSSFICQFLPALA